jgi:hypothetical protein
MYRLKTKITNIRTKLAQMIQYKNGPRSKKLIRKVANIIHLVDIDKLQSDKLTEIIDHYTQKLAVYSKRLCQYKGCTKRKQQNVSFSANPKKFYQKLRTQTNLYTAGLPKSEDITNFWADIWEKSVNYNTKATWLQQEKARATNIPDMTDSEIIKSDIEKAIKKTNNWKAPPPDQLQNFWYKKFTAVHGTMAILMNDLLLILKNYQNT